MNTLRRFILSLAALLLFSGVAMVAPAAARADTSNTNTTSSNDSTSTESSDGNSLAEQFKQEAQDKLQLAHQESHIKTELLREKSCVARKASLTTRMNNAVRQAKKHKAVFDAIYSRVKQFYTTKKLNVTNYSDLTAAVDKAQADAQTKIDALAALDVTVDCSSQTVADGISAFQSAESATRDSLKAYRTALTDLINSLKGASTGTSNTGSSDNTTNGTNQ